MKLKHIFSIHAHTHTHTHIYKLGNKRQTLAYSYLTFLRSQVILMYTERFSASLPNLLW